MTTKRLAAAVLMLVIGAILAPMNVEVTKIVLTCLTVLAIFGTIGYVYRKQMR